jgi:hypothetical protein
VVGNFEVFLAKMIIEKLLIANRLGGVCAAIGHNALFYDWHSEVCSYREAIMNQ